MNNDRIAIYLNEHPEFFNDYPELLTKIKSLDESDMPFASTGTVSLTDRIIKRVNEDQENMKCKLEWLVEISQANELDFWGNTIPIGQAQIKRVEHRPDNPD